MSMEKMGKDIGTKDKNALDISEHRSSMLKPIKNKLV